MGDHLLAKLDSHPKNRNEEAMRLRTNPATKLHIRHINEGRVSRVDGRNNIANRLIKAQHPVTVGKGAKGKARQDRNTHHPAKPYSLCVLVKPRDANADSPSKNWVSGITPLAASKLNHPLLGIVKFV